MSRITFTLVRHAESAANVDSANKIGGHNIEAQLTEKGVKQAEALGNYFLRKGVMFTAAYSSTACRTQKTAELCFKQIGCQLPLCIDPLLLEQDAGGWAGQSRDIYKRSDVRIALDTDNWNYIPGDNLPGESQKMVAERMKFWIGKKVAQLTAAGEDQHIVVFTHGLAIKFLLAELLDLDRPTAYSDVKNPVHNASITQLCFQDGKLTLPLAKRNYTKHL